MVAIVLLVETGKSNNLKPQIIHLRLFLFESSIETYDTRNRGAITYYY